MQLNAVPGMRMWKSKKNQKNQKNQKTGHNLKKVVDNKRVVCYNILRCPAGQFAVGG